MKQLFFTLSITLGVGLCVLAADPPRKLTLAECLQVAEQQHPDLAAARGLITEGQVRRAQANYATAQQNFKRVHDLVSLNVRQAYYGVLAAEEILQARKEAVASQQKHLEQVRAFHEVGTRPKIDVTQQGVALASAQLDVRQAEDTWMWPGPRSPRPLVFPSIRRRSR